MHRSGSARSRCSNNHPQILALSYSCCVSTQTPAAGCVSPRSSIQGDGAATIPKVVEKRDGERREACPSLTHDVLTVPHVPPGVVFWGGKGGAFET